jgi:methionyl-tRNA formyltransferase
MRVVFLGTPDYAAIPLRALAHDPRYELVGVVTQPNRPAGRGRTLVPPPVKLAADELGIPVLQPATLRDPAAIAQLADWQPQVGVVAAYGEILRKAVLGIPPLGYLNIHPSLLPRYRGPTPVPAAILGGDATTGVTVMLLDAKMDSGPILAQHALPLAPDARAGTLTRTLFELGAQMLLEALAGYASGVCVPTPQDEAQASYCPMLHKHDGLIDWRAPAALARPAIQNHRGARRHRMGRPGHARYAAAAPGCRHGRHRHRRARTDHRAAGRQAPDHRSRLAPWPA